MLSERAVILEGKMQELEGQKRLREVWAQRIADCEEGLVLKAAESTYGDWKLPWVKVRNISPNPQPLKIHECS
jgi:DNA ligase-4